LVCFCLFSCNQTPSEPKEIIRAIYHWKSTWQPDTKEKSFLQSQQVNKIYLRFFDVDLIGAIPAPKAVLQKRSSLKSYRVVPVVFITNRSLKDIEEEKTLDLAQNISNKIRNMALIDSIELKEIQLDCDWTVQTRKAYFQLIEAVKHNLKISVSVTIRLHQIKFSTTTGVPPADRGMLMCYNVGDVKNPKTCNSIFDRNIVGEYLEKVNQYPLELDLALPLFEWTVVFRNGKFLRILNQTGEKELLNRSCFSKGTHPSEFVAAKDTLDFGFSVHRGDEFHVEKSRIPDVMDVKNDLLTRIKNNRISLCYYHLDSLTLSAYDSDQLLSIYETHPN